MNDMQLLEKALERVRNRKRRLFSLKSRADLIERDTIKEMGIKLFGHRGDRLIIKGPRGNQVVAEIVVVEQSFWDDKPYCVVNIAGDMCESVSFSIHDPASIIRRL